MTAPVGLGLARVTVAAPKRRIDVALPDNALVAELLPHLLRHAGDELGRRRRPARWLDAAPRHRRRCSNPPATCRPGRPRRRAAAPRPGRVDWPELAYDDVVEVIASGARRAGTVLGQRGHPAVRPRRHQRRCSPSGALVLAVSAHPSVVAGAASRSAMAIAVDARRHVLSRACADADRRGGRGRLRPALRVRRRRSAGRARGQSRWSDIGAPQRAAGLVRRCSCSACSATPASPRSSGCSWRVRRRRGRDAGRDPRPRRHRPRPARPRSR